MKEQLILRNVLKECQTKSNKITEEYRKEQREKAIFKQREAISKRQEKNIQTLEIIKNVKKL